MDSIKNSRRNAIKSCFTAFAAAGMVSEKAFATPKIPGETRVLFLVGDYWHNGVAQESHWRRVLGSTGWRLTFAQSSQFITPETLADTDLFIFARYAGPDSLGWSNEGMIENRPNPAPFMTDEQEENIISNVKRGMGLISMHCGIWNPDRKKYLGLLGVKEPFMHGPVQNVKFHSINAEHPITKGIKDFELDLDENFGAEVYPEKITLLYKSTGMKDNRTDNAAWCREEGKGRVVALLAGHTQSPYQTAEYKTMMFRAAHWAMKRNIPEKIFEKGY